MLFVLPRLAVQAAGLNTATGETEVASYEKMLEDVRSGIFDDPDHPTAVKTELEAVLDSSRCFQILNFKGYE